MHSVRKARGVIATVIVIEIAIVRMVKSIPEIAPIITGIKIRGNILKTASTVSR